MTKKMNRRVRRLWTKALRSGNYEQGQLRLRRNNQFCCLGVLADLYCREVGESWPRAWDTNSFLPEAVRAWAGLATPCPTIDGVMLTVMNDNRMLSFREIADKIEEAL